MLVDMCNNEEHHTMHFGFYTIDDRCKSYLKSRANGEQFLRSRERESMNDAKTKNRREDKNVKA
eukprot:6150526-Amphidinium_carterae.1